MPSDVKFPAKCKTEVGCTRVAKTGSMRSGVEIIEGDISFHEESNIWDTIMDWIN